MHKVVLLIGGNLGDRLSNMRRAEERLSHHMDCERRSSLYETEAWGGKSSGKYLNRVMVMASDKSPLEILEVTQEVEASLGRERVTKWGDRTMDIDILYYDSDFVDLPKLKIPHPLIQERRFALVPLAEVLPDFVHPLLKLNQVELLERTKDRSEVKLFFIPPNS